MLRTLSVVEDNSVSERDMVWQERRLEEILFSNTDAVSKVQQIVRLGFDPEVADELVERHQVGSQMPAYYETLDFDKDQGYPEAEYEPKDDL